MEEFARLADVDKKLRRVTEACHSVLNAGHMLNGGQKRLDKIGQRHAQLAVGVNALQLRIMAAVRVVAEFDDKILAEQDRQIAALGKQSAALDKHAELLAEQTRVAVEALQPHRPLQNVWRCRAERPWHD